MITNTDVDIEIEYSCYWYELSYALFRLIDW